MDSLTLSRRLIRGLLVLNAAMGAGILALFIASLVAPDFTWAALGIRATDSSTALYAGARMIMVIGMLGVPLSHRILTRLLAIVHSVPSGPFVADNAGRLRAMGWALLGLELLNIAVGVVARVAFAPTELTGVRWSFSATRWLGVLMLFVLARVFDEGTRMREDLEGTV